MTLLTKLLISAMCVSALLFVLKFFLHERRYCGDVRNLFKHNSVNWAFYIGLPLMVTVSVVAVWFLPAP